MLWKRSFLRIWGQAMSRRRDDRQDRQSRIARRVADRPMPSRTPQRAAQNEARFVSTAAVLHRRSQAERIAAPRKHRAEEMRQVVRLDGSPDARSAIQLQRAQLNPGFVQKQDELRRLDRRASEFNHVADAAKHSVSLVKQSHFEKQRLRDRGLFSEAGDVKRSQMNESRRDAQPQRERKNHACLTENRPTTNRGSGGGRPFVPWCETGRGKK